MKYSVVETYYKETIVVGVDGVYARRCGKCLGVGFYEVYGGDLGTVYSCTRCKGDCIVGKRYRDVEQLRQYIRRTRGDKS